MHLRLRSWFSCFQGSIWPGGRPWWVLSVAELNQVIRKKEKEPSGQMVPSQIRLILFWSWILSQVKASYVG